MRKTGGDAVKVRCHNCSASGSVRDELVPEGGRWIKSPVCKKKFLVEKGPSGPETAVGGKRERHSLTYSPTYDPTYHITDVGDPELEEDLFLCWWFFGF